MRLVTQSELDGIFEGWDGNTVFRLKNEEAWEQAIYRCQYFYPCRPLVRIWKFGMQYVLEVQGCKEILPVRRIY